MLLFVIHIMKGNNLVLLEMTRLSDDRRADFLLAVLRTVYLIRDSKVEVLHLRLFFLLFKHGIEVKGVLGLWFQRRLRLWLLLLWDCREGVLDERCGVSGV